LRLKLHTGAYEPMWSLHRMLPARSSGRVVQFDTLRLRLRLRLRQLAARVVGWKSRMMIRLPTACPDLAILRFAFERLRRLVI
jgi:hypothetical protein